MKSISVIIPNYNNAHYLKSAINSILNQSFTDYEIIIVDDGSTDNSGEVVGEFGDKVRYIWQENKGLGGARNTGIRASEAEFIGLLDADDEWRPGFLKKMMLLVQSHPDAVVYFSSAQGMDLDGNELPQIFGRSPVSNEIYQNLLRANFIIPSTVIFRRSVIMDAGLFEEKNRGLHGCEDWDLWLRLLPSHLFAGTAESLVRYRLHAQTFSANPAHMQKAVQTVIEKNFGTDDGNYDEWSAEKRRAFGGVYRYRALTSIQKQGNWEAAIEALRRAFEIDPTLTGDLDLFYELSFGLQIPGYRETTYELDLERNVKLVTKMLEKVFMGQPAIASMQKKSFGTANHAMGLVAYNTNHRALSRRLFFRAIVFAPRLLLAERIVFFMVKSFLNPLLVKRLRQFVTGGKYADITK